MKQKAKGFKRMEAFRLVTTRLGMIVMILWPLLPYIPVQAQTGDPLIMTINYGHDWIEGNYAAGHTLWITVTESDGVTVKGTAELVTGEVPWWGGQTGFSTNWQGWSSEQPNIQAGDWISGTLDNGQSAQVQVGTINGDLDLDADTVAGTIHAGWFTQTLSAECGVWEEYGPWRNFTVDPNGGSYLCDFSSDWDLLPGHDVAVQYNEPAGHRVINVFEGPWMRVNYGHDRVGGNYAVGHTVAITVTEGGGAVKATATTDTATDRGWGGEGFQTEWDDWSPEQPNIEPSDRVYIQVDDGYTNVIDVGAIGGDLDVDSDIVAGTIAAGWFTETVEVECHPWGGPDNTPNKSDAVYPDGVDTYACSWDPLTEWDIQPGQEVAVMYLEPDGDRVINVFEGPWMRVNYGHDWVGGDYAVGHTVSITVTEGGGAVKATAVVDTTSDRGWGGEGFETEDDNWSPERPDIEPGDRVYIEVDDGYTNVIDVGAIGGDIDVDSDTIVGTVAAGWFTETVEVECHSWGGPDNTPSKSDTVYPDGVDTYACSWDPVTEWDVQRGQDIAVMYLEPDGDRVIDVFREPSRAVRINQSHDWIEGEATPGAIVVATIWRDGLPVLAETAISESDSEWDIDFCCDDEKDLRAGDVVEIQTSDGVTASIEIIPMTGYVDANADTISGQISGVPLPAQIRARVHMNGPYDEPEIEAMTDMDGNYAIDFGPFDVLPGCQVALWYVQPDGHEVGIMRYGLRLEVDVGRDHVDGDTAPGVPVTVMLNSGETMTTTSDEEGRFWLDFDGDIAALDTVEGWAGTQYASLVVVDVTAQIDDANDKVWGYGPPNSELDVSVNDDWRETFTDGSGYFELQYDWDITPDDDIEIDYDEYLPTEHRTRYRFGPSDVSVEKWTDVWEVGSGDEFSYFIEYWNDARNPATAVTISDTLPAPITYLWDTSGVTPIIDPVSNTLVWHLGTLGAHRSKTFELRVRLETTSHDATHPDFDPNSVVQFGFHTQWADPRGQGTLFGAGSFVDDDGDATIPDHWREAFHWYYEGMWPGEDGVVFIPNSPYQGSDLLANGNTFNSGNMAMTHCHLWYTCCIGDVPNWDIAVVPSYQGNTTAKLHTNMLGGLAFTAHPTETVEAIYYLNSVPELMEVWSDLGLPARTSMQADRIAGLEAQFPGVDWQVAIDGLSYADVPNHQSWMPNFSEADTRVNAFQPLYENTPGLDLDAEIDTLLADLQTIFDNAPPLPVVEPSSPVSPTGTVTIRWATGLQGMSPEQMAAQEQAVADFNASQTDIELVMEVVSSPEALLTQIEAGDPPDIVGPVGVLYSNTFYGLWLDLDPLLAGYDMSDYDPAILDVWRAEGQGLIGLPSTVYPSMIYYNRDLFDAAGLAYPPHTYGELYAGVDPWTIEKMEEIAMLLTLDAGAPLDIHMDNTVEIDDPRDRNPGDNQSGTDNRSGQSGVDLWVRKSVESGPAVEGGTLTYRIEYGNNGSQAADGAVMTDYLPTHTTLVSTTFEVGVDGQAEHMGVYSVTWDIGTLEPGAERQFELTVQIDAGIVPGTLLPNEISIDSGNENDSRDNTFHLTVVVEPSVADLWVDKEVADDLSSGNDFVYRITFGNEGALAAEGVVLTETLPVGMTHLWHSAGSVATVAGDTLVWRLDAVPPDGVGYLLVGVRVDETPPIGTVLTNIVEGATDTPEVDYEDNQAEASLGAPQVICVPWVGDEPHRVWSGLTTRLKGTAKGYGLTSFEWDPGDGSPPITGEIDDPYIIEALHTYDGPVGTVYTATLTVWGAFGWSSSDTYPVRVFYPSHGVSIDVAIDEGLWYLHKAAERYNRGGLSLANWSNWQRDVAQTVVVIQAFQVQGHLPGGDPWENPYVENVQRGWNSLLDFATVNQVMPQPAGDPDGDGDGIGVGVYRDYNHSIYESGLTLMALASTGTPNRVAHTGPYLHVRGRTYHEIAQDMVDWFAWGQNDAESEWARGGWRYQPNSGDSDNSNTQFPVLGLIAAEDNWGVATPTWVKDELRDYWLVHTQNANGAFGYGGDNDMLNVGKTGAGIQNLVWTGVPVTDTRVTSAMQYIEDHWDDPLDSVNWGGNVGDFYAMYAVKKGSQVAGIQQYGLHLWGYEYSAYLVDAQGPDGRFDEDRSMGEWFGDWQPIATAWAVMILSPGLYEPLPVAIIDPIYYGGIGPEWGNGEILFDASTSHHTDPNHEIVLYEWDFGDGSPVVITADPIVAHNYLERGVYVATLTVWDDADNSATASALVYITAPDTPPVADPGGPYSGDIGEEIVLDGSGSYDPDEWLGDAVVLYEWDIGGDVYVSSEPTLAHTWTTAGVFSVTLRVRDRGADFGLDSPKWSEPVTVTVTVIGPNTPPTVEAGPDQTADEGSSVSLAPASFYDPDVLDTHTAIIDWGDGTPVEEGVVATAGVTGTVSGSHIYGDNGVYTVTVTVTDSEGGVGSDTLVVTVDNVAPAVSAWATPASGLPWQDITFTGVFTDPGWLDTHTIAWDFGDGTVVTGSLSAQHAYELDGIYTATLTVADDDGGVGVDGVTIVVQSEAEFKSFQIKHATIHWLGCSGDLAFFRIDGRLTLPDGYTIDDLNRELWLGLSIDDQSVSDTISMERQGKIWSFHNQTCVYCLEDGMRIAKATLWHKPGKSEIRFVLYGVFSMPGVDHHTRPAKATVELGLGLEEVHGIDQITGERTIPFWAHRRVWLYRKHWWWYWR